MSKEWEKKSVTAYTRYENGGNKINLDKLTEILAAISLIFGASPVRSLRIPFPRMEEELFQIHERLRDCVIEHLPWQAFIPKYDRPETFFFIDPPYYKAPEYRYNMALDDYLKMADLLKGIEGKFLLTINDRPEMRSAFSGFEMKEVTLRYSINSDKSTDDRELIFTNYRPASL